MGRNIILIVNFMLQRKFNHTTEIVVAQSDLLFDPFLPLDGRSTRVVLRAATSGHLEAVLLSQHATVQRLNLDVGGRQVNRMHAQWRRQEGLM